MKFGHALAVSAALLALSGCYNDTAQATLGRAYEAAKAGDLATFRSLLADDLLAKYGDADGMKVVTADFSASKKVKLADSVLKQDVDGDGRAKYRLYQVDLKSSDGATLLHSFDVGCDVTWEMMEEGGGQSCHPGPGGIDICVSRPSRDVLRDFEACKILGINS